MHELRSPSFIQNLGKSALPEDFSKSLTLVTLEQQLYPLTHLKLPERFDVGLRVSRLSDFRFKLDIGLFRPSESKPSMLGSVEQSFSDEKQRAIRIPRNCRSFLSKISTRIPKNKFASL
jgi:acyl-CoA thioesterase FadM